MEEAGRPARPGRRLRRGLELDQRRPPSTPSAVSPSARRACAARSRPRRSRARDRRRPPAAGSRRGASPGAQSSPAGSSSSAQELMQNRWPVGFGPSSNTCPRWPPHVAQSTSMRDHAVAQVEPRLDRVELGGLDEARPARARVVLRVRAEELGAAARAPVDARLLRVPVRPGERSLGALPPQDRVLLGRQALAPLLVAELDPARPSHHHQRDRHELRHRRGDDEQVEHLVEAEGRAGTGSATSPRRRALPACRARRRRSRARPRRRRRREELRDREHADPADRQVGDRLQPARASRPRRARGRARAWRPPRRVRARATASCPRTQRSANGV